MKRFIFVLLTCSFSFGLALAAPPYHAPAHPPVRPPVMVRPPTLPNQQILEQRRLREVIESRREEEIPSSIQDDEVFWSDAHDLSHGDLRTIFRDIEPQISGLDDETRDEAKQRVIADLENTDLDPEQKERVRREIEFKFHNDKNTADAHRDNFVSNVTSNFLDLTRNLTNPSQGDIATALREAIVLTNNKFLKDLNIHTGGSFSRFGHSFDLNIDRSVDNNLAFVSVGPAVQAMRIALGGGNGPSAQIASLEPAIVTPAPVPAEPAAEVAAKSEPSSPAGVEITPSGALEDTKPLAINTPPVRETAVAVLQVGPENTHPVVNATPSVRETVAPSQPATPSPDLLTAVPTYTPTDSHSTPTTTVPIRTASVPSLRERPMMPPTNSGPNPSGPSLIGSVAAVVGPAIKSGLVTVANWMDSHDLLGRGKDRRGDREMFHGIGNGAFEGRLGFNMTPQSVIKGGIVRGSNIGGGLVL